MKINKQFFKAFTAAICLSMITFGLWTIDISVSAIQISSMTPLQVEVTSGWWVRDPVLQYHIGLYIVQIAALIMAAITFYEITNNIERRE